MRVTLAHDQKRPRRRLKKEKEKKVARKLRVTLAHDQKGLGDDLKKEKKDRQKIEGHLL